MGHGERVVKSQNFPFPIRCLPFIVPRLLRTLLSPPGYRGQNLVFIDPILVLSGDIE